MPTQSPDNGPLLRMGKRRLSSYAVSAETFLHELVPGRIDESRSQDYYKWEYDLRPSTYEKFRDDTELQIVAMVAEHAASFLANPPSITHVYDARFHGVVAQATPGTTLFRLTMSRHRELLFRSKEQLIAVVQTQWGWRSRRLLKTVRRDEVKKYAEERLTATDPEWLARAKSAQTLPQHQGRWVLEIARKLWPNFPNDP